MDPQGETEQEVVESIVSLFPDNQIPNKFYAHCNESNLTVGRSLSLSAASPSLPPSLPLQIPVGRPKRSIHIVLARVSSSFRRIIDSMVRLTEDERYNASGLLSDMRELMVEV